MDEDNEKPERPVGYTLRAHLEMFFSLTLPNMAAFYHTQSQAAETSGDETHRTAYLMGATVCETIAEDLQEMLEFTDREAAFHGHRLSEKLSLSPGTQTITVNTCTVDCRCEDQRHARDPGFQFLVRKGGETVADPVMTFADAKQLASVLIDTVDHHGGQ